MGEITNLIKEIATKNKVIETFAAKVIKINTEEKTLHDADDAYTVDVMRADGAIIKNVRLKADIQTKEEGIIIIPKKDSWVLASIIENVETRAFISQFSEIERIITRIKKGDKHYFEIETLPSQFNMLFKEKEGENSNGTTPTYKKRAQFEFDGTNEQPKLTTSFFDKDGKEISKTTQSGTLHQTVLSTINGSDSKARISCTLDTASAPTVTLQINDSDANEKQKIVIDESHTEIKVKDGYTAEVSKEKACFKKDQLTFQMEKKFKMEAEGKNLKTELENVLKALEKLTVTTPMGPSGIPINVADFTNAKMNLNQILE
ncbi:MAG: hypothetical protein QM535_03315 [Limnohabitans sp.]|nr:hypothetical protein [Limnohabitans sp.]